MNDNQIQRYARTILKSEWTRVHPKLQSDLDYILSGGAIYLPNWFCPASDQTLLKKLLSDLESAQLQNWSKHLKVENPQFSPTFLELIQRMADHFGVDVFATRLNVYTNESAWKPYHHDSHAFANGMKEDFTMGASFGCTRKLSFKHPSTEQSFDFPQNNGDVFAFDSEVNKRFMHGVPKSRQSSGLRISIIAWGRRRQVGDLVNALTNALTTQDSTISVDVDRSSLQMRDLVVEPVQQTQRTNTLKERIQSRQANRGNTVQSGWARR
jgi:hypothetical protein